MQLHSFHIRPLQTFHNKPFQAAHFGMTTTISDEELLTRTMARWEQEGAPRQVPQDVWDASLRVKETNRGLYDRLTDTYFRKV